MINRTCIIHLFLALAHYSNLCLLHVIQLYYTFLQLHPHHRSTTTDLMLFVVISFIESNLRNHQAFLPTGKTRKTDKGRGGGGGVGGKGGGGGGGGGKKKIRCIMNKKGKCLV